eukprot:1136805-Amphidinium_carterae.1
MGRHYDIFRAHFMGRAQRTIFIELPDADAEKHGPEYVRLLLRSMYGTQDASHIWQEDYCDLLVNEGGFVRGRHNAATFYHPSLEIRLMVHGDNFFVVRGEAGLTYVDELLRSRYSCKNLGTLGFDAGDAKELLLLMVPDARHAQLVIEELGLRGNSKAVTTPREKLADAV